MDKIRRDGSGRALFPWEASPKDYVKGATPAAAHRGAAAVVQETSDADQTAEVTPANVASGAEAADTSKRR